MERQGRRTALNVVLKLHSRVEDINISHFEFVTLVFMSSFLSTCSIFLPASKYDLYAYMSTSRFLHRIGILLLALRS